MPKINKAMDIVSFAGKVVSYTDRNKIIGTEYLNDKLVDVTYQINGKSFAMISAELHKFGDNLERGHLLTPLIDTRITSINIMSGLTNGYLKSLDLHIQSVNEEELGKIAEALEGRHATFTSTKNHVFLSSLTETSRLTFK